jgi:uncharacterized coiled-coil protein SlyX
MAERDEVIERLEKRIAQLEAIVLRQAARIGDLEHRLRKSSSDSNQPPSSDRPGASPRSQAIHAFLVKEAVPNLPI